MSSARAVSVSWNDGCANWSACSAARPWKPRFSSKRSTRQTALAAAIMERSEGPFAMKAVSPVRT